MAHLFTYNYPFHQSILNLKPAALALTLILVLMPYSSLTLARRMALMKALATKARRAKALSRPKTTSGLAKPYGYGLAPRRTKAEVKFFDSAFPATAIPAGPASIIDPTVVAEIQNGTGPQARIGRKIKITKIDFSFTIVLNGGTAAQNTDCVRYDIWLDKQANGAAPAPGNLYTALAGVPGTTQMPNLFNERRFVRLYSDVHQFNMQNTSGVGQSNVGRKVEGSIYPQILVEYDDSTGAITDLTSNNVLQAWGSDGGFCFITANFIRVHYVDA